MFQCNLVFLFVKLAFFLALCKLKSAWAVQHCFANMRNLYQKLGKAITIQFDVAVNAFSTDQRSCELASAAKTVYVGSILKQVKSKIIKKIGIQSFPA